MATQKWSHLVEIFGRNKEVKKLDEFFHSKKSEFMAVYGRRRVGKTHLIKTYFTHKNCIFFSATGVNVKSFKSQREVFCAELSKQLFQGLPLETPKTWFKIFEMLDKAVQDSSREFVIFLDEFPWMATAKSKLLQTVEYFWNQRWNFSGKVKLVVCGSQSSWIIRHLIDNTGGLYHRVTYRLAIEPFNLYQTEQFIKKFLQLSITRNQILKLYYVMGGIPLYLEQIKKGKSADQIINEVCFNKTGLLFDEMNELFKSLFKANVLYMKITREIAKYRYGISKQELAKKFHLHASGRLNDRLKELEDTGFIISFLPYQHTEKGIYYRILDEYTYFYFSWIEPNIRAIKKLADLTDFWFLKSKEPRYQAWKGYTFESICYKHVLPITKVFGIHPTSIPYFWHYTPKTKTELGTQIDLLLDRPDDAITMCEIKCTDKPYAINKTMATTLKNKLEIFQEQTKTKKQLFMAMISENGIKDNQYSKEILSGIATLDDLFE